MIQTAATLDDLMRFDGKAELIAGRIVPIMPNGFWPVAVALLEPVQRLVGDDVGGVAPHDGLSLGPDEHRVEVVALPRQHRPSKPEGSCALPSPRCHLPTIAVW